MSAPSYCRVCKVNVSGSLETHRQGRRHQKYLPGAITVNAFPGKCTQDDLYNYFQQFGRIAGTMFEQSQNQIIYFFEDKKSVDSVVHMKHKIKNVDVCVRPTFSWRFDVFTFHNTPANINVMKEKKPAQTIIKGNTVPVAVIPAANSKRAQKRTAQDEPASSTNVDAKKIKLKEKLVKKTHQTHPAAAVIVKPANSNSNNHHKSRHPPIRDNSLGRNIKTQSRTCRVLPQHRQLYIQRNLRDGRKNKLQILLECLEKFKRDFEADAELVSRDLKAALGTILEPGEIRIAKVCSFNFLDDTQTVYLTKSVKMGKVAELIKKCRKFEKQEKLHTDADLSMRFLHRNTQIICLIQFGSVLLVHRDCLISAYISLSPKISTLVFLVQYWAECFGLKTDHCLTTEDICLLVIFYLQNTEYHLPAIFNATTTLGTVDGWDCLGLKQFHNKQANNKINAAKNTTILEGFFWFYSDFDYITHIVCPFAGTSVKKEAFLDPELSKIPTCLAIYKKNCNNHPTCQLPLTSGLCIQDPVVHNVNLTKDVSLKSSAFFVEACRRMWDNLKIRKIGFLGAASAPDFGKVKEFWFRMERPQPAPRLDWPNSVNNVLVQLLNLIMSCELISEDMNPEVGNYNAIWVGKFDTWHNRYKSKSSGDCPFIREIVITQRILKLAAPTPCDYCVQVKVLYNADFTEANIVTKVLRGDFEYFGHWNNFLRVYMPMLLKEYLTEAHQAKFPGPNIETEKTLPKISTCGNQNLSSPEISKTEPPSVVVTAILEDIYEKFFEIIEAKKGHEIVELLEGSVVSELDVESVIDIADDIFYLGVNEDKGHNICCETALQVEDKGRKRARSSSASPEKKKTKMSTCENTNPSSCDLPMDESSGETLPFKIPEVNIDHESHPEIIVLSEDSSGKKFDIKSVIDKKNYVDDVEDKELNHFCSDKFNIPEADLPTGCIHLGAAEDIDLSSCKKRDISKSSCPAETKTKICNSDGTTLEISTTILKEIFDGVFKSVGMNNEPIKFEDEIWNNIVQMDQIIYVDDDSTDECNTFCDRNINTNNPNILSYKQT